MVLVDTCVWVEHLRKGDQSLVELLEDGKVLMHPMVLGELALGSLKKREEFLSFLHYLPKADIASDEEVLLFLEKEQLYAKGIGWVDISLLASARLSSADFYSFDKRLKRQWEKLQ